MTNDSVHGAIGDDGSGNAAGKGIQQVSIDLGNRTPAEISQILRDLPKINEVIFGDGLRWNGIVRELQRLEEHIRALTIKVDNMENKLSAFERKYGKRNEPESWTNRAIQILIALVTFSVLVQLWQTFS